MEQRLYSSSSDTCIMVGKDFLCVTRVPIKAPLSYVYFRERIGFMVSVTLITLAPCLHLGNCNLNVLLTVLFLFINITYLIYL